MNAIIIVRYESDKQSFLLTLKTLSENYQVYIYDNSKEPIVFNKLNNIYYYHDHENSGLARAINHCIDQAIIDRIQVCIYFDQDSAIDGKLIDSLFSSYETLKLIEPNLFAIGPQPVMASGDFYPVRINKNLTSEYFFANEIITSGMTFSPRDIMDIGYFDESLFLDMLDFEICWRARSNRKSIFIDRNITMIHEVGLNLIKIPFKLLPISSPIRNYYQIRNMLYLALYKRNKSFLTICYFLLRRISNIFFNILLADNRLLRLKYNFWGVRDAIKKDMGKLKANQ